MEKLDKETPQDHSRPEHRHSLVKWCPPRSGFNSLVSFDSKRSDSTKNLADDKDVERPETVEGQEVVGKDNAGLDVYRF